tara:strand:+ start:2976 stop:3107 length:132 start_codon:yes stop_codon:yes gene_type:complete
MPEGSLLPGEERAAQRSGATVKGLDAAGWKAVPAKLQIKCGTL